MVAVVVVAGAATAVVTIDGQRRGRDQQAARATVRQYLDDWGAGRYGALAGLTDGSSGGLAARYRKLDTALGLAGLRVGQLRASGDNPVVVRYTAVATLQGLGRWTDRGSVSVVRRSGRSLVHWTPSAITAGLAEGQTLRVTRHVPTRAAVLSADDVPLASDPDLSNAIAGPVARATAREARADPVALRPGDLLGTGNLEALDNSRLAGRPSGAVQLVTTRGQVVRTLTSFAGRAPTPVHTTLNMRLQRLAESVLGGAGHPAALVAVDASSGALLAAASTSATFPLGLLGRFPPGSTFKMVTLTAALQHGWTLSRTVACTPTITIDGRVFHNATGEVAGQLTLEQAFAVSCNTAFMRVAESLPSGALLAAAKSYGCDVGHAPLAVVSYGCSVPTQATGTDYAAEAIGQGTVLTSPLMIAAIAAGIDAGTWHQPTVTPGDGGVTHPLPADVDAELHAAMRAVVTSGTGVPANLPGAPVYGKTGTAEYGTGNPPPTDAWFAAFRGSLAVAVVVQGAGFGEQSAAPLVARFLAGAGG